MATASATTQSAKCGDFPKARECPRIGRLSCRRSVSTIGQLGFGTRFGAFVSGLEIPFPGNGDCRPRRLGSNDGANFRHILQDAPSRKPTGLACEVSARAFTLFSVWPLVMQACLRPRA